MEGTHGEAWVSIRSGWEGVEACNCAVLARRGQDVIWVSEVNNAVYIYHSVRTVLAPGQETGLGSTKERKPRYRGHLLKLHLESLSASTHR